VLRLGGTPSVPADSRRRELFLRFNRELLEAQDRQVPRASPWRVLDQLDALAVEFHPDSEIGSALTKLSQQLSDGSSAAAWIGELGQDAEVLRRRATRTRNAIVHGGPFLDEVAAGVVGFHDALARTALSWSTEAQIAGESVVAAFARRRAKYEDALAQLKAGGRPLDVLPRPGAG
jgi:hypothetical protein